MHAGSVRSWLAGWLHGLVTLACDAAGDGGESLAAQGEQAGSASLDGDSCRANDSRTSVASSGRVTRARGRAGSVQDRSGSEVARAPRGPVWQAGTPRPPAVD